PCRALNGCAARPLPCSFSIRRAPGSTLFPYTTLFRSVVESALDVAALGVGLAFVAEDRPHLLLVVEADDEAAANGLEERRVLDQDRKSTRLNSSHVKISYAVFCLKKKMGNEHLASCNA